MENTDQNPRKTKHMHLKTFLMPSVGAFSPDNLGQSLEGEFMRGLYHQFVPANYSYQNSKVLGDMPVQGGRRDVIGHRGIIAEL